MEDQWFARGHRRAGVIVNRGAATGSVVPCSMPSRRTVGGKAGLQSGDIVVTFEEALGASGSPGRHQLAGTMEEGDTVRIATGAARPGPR
jgi:hypothetical protein